MQTIRNYSEILLSHKLEPTPARIKILTECIEARSPQTVADVAAGIGDKAHLATVYRTLELFVKVHILERLDFQEGKFRYEYIEDHHHHAFCENCGSVDEIQDQALEKQMKKIKVATGFSITRHSLELFGLCKNCQQKGYYAK